ncbi:unnamed protein product [Soboliphyme baturini]|uniref:Transposase n=1 Tax=Soboliphyme baturini TaxID=241478 RepID=A0A183IQX1_9BILA|nr:unnamed protein product [Soboliphyme baturini]
MHVDEDGGLIGTLSLPEDTFVIEPAWRHISGASHSESIIYRISDMKIQRHPQANRAAVVDKPKLWNSKRIAAAFNWSQTISFTKESALQARPPPSVT